MDAYNERGDQDAPCCLDCVHRELRGELYGGTSYWCALRGEPISPSRVLLKACDRFQRWNAG